MNTLKNNLIISNKLLIVAFLIMATAPLGRLTSHYIFGTMLTEVQLEVIQSQLLYTLWGFLMVYVAHVGTKNETKRKKDRSSS